MGILTIPGPMLPRSLMTFKPVAAKSGGPFFVPAAQGHGDQRFAVSTIFLKVWTGRDGTIRAWSLTQPMCTKGGFIERVLCATVAYT